MIDLFDLERFLTAQGLVYDTALQELRGGRKRTHWMWFVFAQLRGLGHSFRAQFYGLVSMDEARAYLTHPVLGPRLEACTHAVMAHPGLPLHTLFGSPDDMKFHSSMTVFALAASGRANPYQQVLDQWFLGSQDERTLAILDSSTISS
jgi:uncharacterized protein (DUF1810 family)